MIRMFIDELWSQQPLTFLSSSAQELSWEWCAGRAQKSSRKHPQGTLITYFLFSYSELSELMNHSHCFTMQECHYIYHCHFIYTIL